MARRFITRSRATRSILVSFAIVSLAACGSGSDPKAPNYKIQATVTGLTDGNSVVLQVTDAGSSATVAKNGIVDLLYGGTGARYHVTVKTPPSNPPETCTISHGEGTIGTSDVTDVLVTCSEKTFNISVSVTGLAGTGLSVCENYTDGTCASAVPITSNGMTVIRSSLADGVAYLLVFAGGQPANPWQTCKFTNGSSDGSKAGGTIRGADVAVAIACTTNQYFISGTITGLIGTGLKLSTSGQDDVMRAAGATSFTFARPVDSGTSFDVSVTAQPTNPWQKCVVSFGSGTVAGQDTNALVACTTNEYAVGGTVSQLRSSMVLTVVNESDQTSQDVTVSSGTAPFQFTKKLASGSRYRVAVKTQPANPKQLCSVSQGAGVVGGGDISATVTCQTYHQISGTVLGHQGTGLTVTLSGASGNFTPLTSSADASGNYVFSDILDGTYTITPSASPSCWSMSPQSIGVALVWNGVDSSGNDFATTLSPSVKNWCPMAPMPSEGEFIAVSGTSASDVWTLTPPYTLSHWNGTAWTTATTSTASIYSYKGLWADSPGDVWPYGSPMIDHWNGSQLSYVQSPSSGWKGAWGTGPSNIWFVGNLVTNWNGTSYSTSEVGPNLNDVWGSSASSVWAVGQDGFACHRDASSWTSYPSGTTNQLNGVWGSSSIDVWAVGSAGTIVHWNGTQWSPSAYSNVATTKDLSRIWGSGANDVWAVGAGGTIIHWNGSSWSEVASGVNADLKGVWGSGSKDVWAVGGNTILRWRDQ